MKRKNIKTKLIVFLIIVIAASGLTVYMLLNRKSANSNAEINIIKHNETNSKTDEDKIDTPKIPPRYVVYDIFGSSKNLTPKEIKSMQKMRDDVKKIAMKKHRGVFLNGQPSSKSVCLTFDDGPDNTITPKVIDVLDSYNVKGNFFFIGDSASKYPEVVKKAYKSGHLIGNHSYNHLDYTTISSDKMKSQISQTDDIIFKEIGKHPLMVRPPYGSINDKVDSYINSNGAKIIIWSIDTLDWSQKEDANIVKNVTDNLRAGDIILMHSNSDKAATLKALPTIIQKIKAKGYNITTLDKMLNCDGYK